jgi:hypothetical protein
MNDIYLSLYLFDLSLLLPSDDYSKIDAPNGDVQFVSNSRGAKAIRGFYFIFINKKNYGKGG